MNKRKRIALCKKDGLTMRFEYGYISDSEFEDCLKELASKAKVNIRDIIIYNLGTDEEMKNGKTFFCPRCGEYNEYGYEPETRLYYHKDGEEFKPAGYYKELIIECDSSSCKHVFRISTDQFQEESMLLSLDL